MVRVWRFYFQGMYKGPREALWVVSTFLFLAAAGADFTGRLLPGRAGVLGHHPRLEILAALPVVGPLFRFLVGGEGVDSLILIRFYFLHAVILPGLILVLFYLNFSAVRRVGLSARPARAGPRPASSRSTSTTC